MKPLLTAIALILVGVGCRNAVSKSNLYPTKENIALAKSAGQTIAPEDTIIFSKSMVYYFRFNRQTYEFDHVARKFPGIDSLLNETDTLHKTIDSLTKIIKAFRTIYPVGTNLEIKYNFSDSTVTISTCGSGYYGGEKVGSVDHWDCMECPSILSYRMDAIFVIGHDSVKWTLYYKPKKKK